MLTDKTNKWFPHLYFFFCKKDISTIETHLISMRNVQRAVLYDRKIIGFSNSLQYMFPREVSQDMNKFIWIFGDMYHRLSFIFFNLTVEANDFETF